MKNHLFIASMCITLTSIMHAESFDSFEQAFVAPEKVTTLSITKYDPVIKHLPSQLGTLINLVELDISCLENLEDLPSEIGNLKKLEKLIIDNGNGCQMNISLPESIGNLSNLKVLRLYGALDPTPSDTNEPIPPSKVKSIPSQIASLQNLKRLALDHNDIDELPAFVGNLKNLQELSVCDNGGIKLPTSLSNLNGLKIFMGNNSLKIKDQKKLRRLFPKATFSFENEFDDSAANEETPK